MLRVGGWMDLQVLAKAGWSIREMARHTGYSRHAVTKLVAVGYASNIVGTINPVTEITKLAHAAGAMIFVDAVHYAGAPEARPAPGVVEAIDEADVIVITPSNPYVSIGPILAVDEIRLAVERRRVPCVAVSPLIGGRAVKGPADRMLERIAGGTTPAHVASCYEGLIDALVLDEADAPTELAPGVRAVVTATLMHDADARRRLAQDVLEAAGALA